MYPGIPAALRVKLQPKLLDVGMSPRGSLHSSSAPQRTSPRVSTHSEQDASASGRLQLKRGSPPTLPGSLPQLLSWAHPARVGVESWSRGLAAIEWRGGRRPQMTSEGWDGQAPGTAGPQRGVLSSALPPDLVQWQACFTVSPAWTMPKTLCTRAWRNSTFSSLPTY